jgi:hypothetical protein
VPAPFVKAYVLYNGDMVLCNLRLDAHDDLGNVMHEPSRASGAPTARRRSAAITSAGALPRGSLCARCDYPYLHEAP